MTTGNIRLLEDKQGVPFFPVSHPSAIVDDNGKSVEEYLTDSVSVTQFGAKGDGVTDDTTAIQNAINYCLANHRDLEIPKLCKITSSLIIDRQVDGANFDSYFNIVSTSGGGIYVDTPIKIFSTSIPYVADPVSQLIRWNNLRFVAVNSEIEAYVLDGAKFLRSEFVGCSFSKIKCLVSTGYVQSIHFTNCNARRWTGTFFKVLPQGYDIQVIGGLYEGGVNCFDITTPIGCKFFTIIEGMSGTALKINGAQGVDISCYFEANGMDIDSRTGGLPNYGITLHGSYISHTNNNDYSVKWGTCIGCVSYGNLHNNNMHDLQLDSIVDINDIALTNVSNLGGKVYHRGYEEGDTSQLPIRTDNNDAYTVSDMVSKFTKIGNRMEINFKCILTSTGTNLQGNLYIPYNLGKTQHSLMMCGQIEVVGSTINNGISPLYVSNGDPMRVMSSLPVIPANTAGQQWLVRGYISYIE